MKRFFALCVIVSLVMPFAGCDKTAEDKTHTTVTTPDAGTSTTTDTHSETAPK
jgi:hypothetical protein